MELVFVFFYQVSKILNEGCDKKKITNKITEVLLMIPIPVYLVIVAVLNYIMGSLMADINKMYSAVTETQKTEFFVRIISTIILWIIIMIFDTAIVKISNMRMLNRNYMKWISKLTFSKVSSITKVGTGGISSAVHTISQCDKEMINTVMNVLPYIVPFLLICKEEYNTAGIIPIIVNVVYIIIMVIMNIFIASLKCNKIAAKAGAAIKSCTTDCIYNSKTIKYFNKEDWSINRQLDTQNKIFWDIINLKKNFLISAIFRTLVWFPTLINIYLCWDNITIVLFILMSDYALNCISDSIMTFIDLWGEKKANLAILGNLEEDNVTKKPIEKSLEVRDVVFKYSKESKVTFRIDNIAIEKGHRYCITGKSGFGKSTFIKLLTKTVEPDIAGGQIDSVDTIYMFAESEMFNDTVMENISLGDTSVTVSEVEDILANLEVVLDLDIEHDPVGEKGEALSTGQRQRINLARVIVYARRHPGVLVALDEVTSALDEITSVNCINYIAEEFERLGTTLLYVSNKSDYKDTNLITDNIYVERNGDVVTYVQK